MKKKKKISGSIVILIGLVIAAIVFTVTILYLMSARDMPEPSTLIMSVFGFLAAIEGTALGMRVSEDKYRPEEFCEECIE